jgi:hypothetical protein
VRYQYGQSRGRLSPLLYLSALALVVGVLGACGSSDSGQDVQPEPEAAVSSRCPNPSDAGAQAVPSVDWEDCDLSGANLSGAVLWDADLTGAHLTGADLTGADLTGADLTGADLTGADLTGANLSDTNLRDADLSGQDLSDANLNRAICNGNTRWPDGSKGHGSTCPT